MHTTPATTSGGCRAHWKRPCRPQIGVLLYAPLLVLAGVTGYSLWKRHRERIAQAFPEEQAVEVAALLMGASASPRR